MVSLWDQAMRGQIEQDERVLERASSKGRYTDDEVAFLVEAMGKMSLAKVAERLGRTPNAIAVKIHELRQRSARGCGGDGEDYDYFREKQERDEEQELLKMRSANEVFLQKLRASSGGENPWIPAKVIVSDCRGSAN